MVYVILLVNKIVYLWRELLDFPRYSFSDRNELFGSLEFCGGKLVHLYRKGPPQLRHIRYPTIWTKHIIFFWLDNKTYAIRSLKKLRLQIGHCNCSIDTWVRDHEAQFANIIAPLFGDLGYVVTPKYVPHYYYEEKFGIDTTKNLPRLEGMTLRFLLCDRKWHGPDIISDVSLDLRSLEYTYESTEYYFDQREQGRIHSY